MVEEESQLIAICGGCGVEDDLTKCSGYLTVPKQSVYYSVNYRSIWIGAFVTLQSMFRHLISNLWLAGRPRSSGNGCIGDVVVKIAV